MKKLTFRMKVNIKTCCLLILWFWWRWSTISKVPKIASLQCLYNIPKKLILIWSWWDEVDFLHAAKYQSDLQVDFNTLDTKVGYKVILLLLISMMKHSQITQSNNFANLCNSSKKLGMEFIFCMEINTKVSKNWRYRFWWKQQIRRLVIFLQYITKKVFYFLIIAFVFYCDVKHLDILWGSSHVCCYLFLVYSKMGAIFYTMTLKSNKYNFPTGNVLELGFPKCFE